MREAFEKTCRRYKYYTLKETSTNQAFFFFEISTLELQDLCQRLFISSNIYIWHCASYQLIEILNFKNSPTSLLLHCYHCKQAMTA